MTIWRRVACWFNKEVRSQAHSRARAATHIRVRMHTHTHTHTEIFSVCDDSGFVNAPQCYVTRTVPVLLLMSRHGVL